jgi:hypothetical protein
MSLLRQLRVDGLANDEDSCGRRHLLTPSIYDILEEMIENAPGLIFQLTRWEIQRQPGYLALEMIGAEIRLRRAGRFRGSVQGFRKGDNWAQISKNSERRAEAVKNIFAGDRHPMPGTDRTELRAAGR